MGSHSGARRDIPAFTTSQLWLVLDLATLDCPEGRKAYTREYTW